MTAGDTREEKHMTPYTLIMLGESKLVWLVIPEGHTIDRAVGQVWQTGNGWRWYAYQPAWRELEHGELFGETRYPTREEAANELVLIWKTVAAR